MAKESMTKDERTTDDGPARPSKIKIRSIALDDVEAGTDEFVLAHSETKTRAAKLPDGVKSIWLYRDILQIAWPTLVELTLTSLTSMADLMMVGGLGAWALSSVSLATQPKFILMTTFMAMNVGATALVARCKGAGNPEKANLVMRQAFLMTFVLGALSSVLGYIFAGPLIKLMGTTDAECLAGGVSYLRIQMFGFLTMALTSTITAVLRGVGQTRASMVYNIIANVVNVFFNYLLINGHWGFPRLEVDGASYATIIGQFVAFIIALVIILRPGQYLKLSFKDSFMPDWPVLREIMKIGFPAMLENVVMRVGAVIFTRMVVGLGRVLYATHSVCMNIQALSFMTGQAFATSATTLMGQSLGKKRPDMGEAYSSRARKVGLVSAVILGAVFFFFGRGIVSMYNDDPVIINTGAQILVFVAFLQPFQSSQFIIAGALRGAGDTRSVAYIVMITTMIIRPVMAAIAIYWLDWGIYGAWAGMVSDQLLRSLLVLMRYQSGKWKKIKIKI